MQRMIYMVVCACVVALVGCSYTVKLDPNIDPTANIANALPLRVGLFIPEETKTYVMSDRSDLDKYTFQVGEALESIITKSTQRVFKEVEILDANPTEQMIGDLALDYAIIAKVTSAKVALNSDEGFFQDSLEGSTQLSVQLSFLDPRLIQAASVLASGQGIGSKGRGAFSTGKSEYSASVESALRNLGDDLIHQMYGNYDIRKMADQKMAPAESPAESTVKKE